MRKISLYILIIMVTFLAVGCSNSGDLNKNNDDKSNKIEESTKINKKDIQLTLAVSKSSEEEEKTLDAIIEKFQKEYPNIKINKQIIMKDYDSAIEKKVGSSKEVDIFFTDVSKFPLYISKGYIESIDNYIDKNILNDFYPSIVNSFEKDGKIFGLPGYYNLMVLFYNKNMFKNADIENPPSDWRELEIACDKIVKKKMNGLVFDNNLEYFGTFMLQAGGKIIDDGNLVLNSPSCAKGLAYYYTLIKKGYADTAKNLNQDSSINAFLNDKSAMYIGKSSLINKIQSSTYDKYGIAVLPKGVRNGNFIFTHSYVISKNSEHKNEAAEFIKFIISKEGQSIISESGIGVPSRISMGYNYLEIYPERKILIDMLYNSYLYQFGEKHDDIVRALMKASNEVRLKKVIPKDALNAAIDEIEKLTTP